MPVTTSSTSAAPPPTSTVIAAGGAERAVVGAQVAHELRGRPRRSGAYGVVIVNAVRSPWVVAASASATNRSGGPPPAP